MEYCNAHQVVLHPQHPNFSKTYLASTPTTQAKLLNDDHIQHHTSNLSPEGYVDREFPTPWTSPTSSSHWLSPDLPEGKSPCPLFPKFLYMILLETPWNLGCTPVDVHNDLSITLTEELLDYVAQNSHKNILQGMAQCSKLIDNAMYRLNHNYKYCTSLCKLHKELSSQAQTLIYGDPPVILTSPSLAEMTPSHSNSNTKWQSAIISVDLPFLLSVYYKF